MSTKNITTKGLSTMLALILIFSLALPAFAEGLGSGTKADPFVTDAVFSIGSTIANAGDEGITLTVLVEECPAFAAIGLEFAYNTAALTLTDIKQGKDLPYGGFTVGTYPPENTVLNGIVIIDYNEDITLPKENAEILTLEFSIDPDAAGDEYEIQIGLSDAAWVNYATQYLTATAFNSGTITVTESPDRGVCTYDGEGYLTINEAIDAIMDDNGTGTITMTKDTTILEFSDRIIISNGANITLDVNGRTINSEVASGNRLWPHWIVEIEPGGSLNLVDESSGTEGKFICTTQEIGSSFLLNSGNLNMNNINVEDFIFGIQDGSVRTGGTAGTYGTISNCKLDTGAEDAMDFGDGEVDTIENCEIFTKGHGIIIGHDYQGGSINLIENCTLENSDWNTNPLVFVKKSGAIETIKGCNIIHHDSSAISVNEATGHIGAIDGGSYIGGGSYGSAITSGGTIDHVLSGIFIGGWDAIYNRGNINTISGGSFFGNESALTNGGAIDSLEGGYYKTATNSNWIVVEDGSTCTSPEGYNLSTVPMRPSDFDGKEGFYHFGETADITWAVEGQESITDKFVIGDPVYYSYGEPAIEGYSFKGWTDGETQYRPNQSLPAAATNITYTALLPQVGAEEDYEVSIETSKENINQGENFSVDVLITSEGNDAFYGADIEVIYDNTKVNYNANASTKVEGFGITSSTNGTTATLRISGAASTGYTMTDHSFKAATLAFTAKTGIPSGTTTIALGEDPIVDQQTGFHSQDVGKGDDLTLNLWNLTVTFRAGDNVTLAQETAYVKYDEAGLYTDSTYTTTFTEPEPVPEDYYTLDEPLWKLADGDNVSFETIEEIKFTADAIYTATASPCKYDITVPGKIAVISGVTDEKATYLTPVVFTASADPGYEVSRVYYTIDDGAATELTPDVNGQYTIPGSAITGNIVIGSPEQLIAGGITFESSDDFNALLRNTQLLVLTVDNKLATGAYQYAGDSMFYSSKYGNDGKHAYLYIVDKDITADDAREQIQIVSDDLCVELEYDGDINRDTRLNSTDAVVAFALYNGVWADESFPVDSKADMRARLEADVNGDKVVDTTDAQKILHAIWGEPDWFMPTITLSKESADNREEGVTFSVLPVEGAVFYYTLDGTVPTDQSTLYTGEVTLTAPDEDEEATVTIKVVGLKEGSNYSGVAVRTVTYGGLSEDEKEPHS